MGLIIFCALRIVAQSSFPELFAMPCTNPNQRAELERRETREQQEDMSVADLPGSPLEDLGPLFLKSYVLKMFCAWIGMG